MFTLGEDHWGWEQLKKIVPFTHKSITTTPFVMPNSYIYNPEIEDLEYEIVKPLKLVHCTESNYNNLDIEKVFKDCKKKLK